MRDGRILEGVGRNSIDSRINGALSASSVGFKLQNPISRTPKAICCPFENAEGLFTSRRRCSVGGQLTDNSLPQPEPGLARHKVAANTKQHNFFPHFLLPFAKVADHFSDV